MAQRRLNIDLQEEIFPVLSSMVGDGVIVPDFDQSIKKPELLWVENILPISRGYASISRTNVVSPTIFPAGLLDLNAPARTNVYVVQNAERTSTYLLVYGLYHYIFDSLNNTWILAATVGDAEIMTSVFFFRGRSYIYHPSIGVKGLDNAGTGYEDITLEGLNLANIRTMTTAGNYIVAADADTIYWGAPLNPFYFTPAGEGINANAGSTKASAIRGSINIMVSSNKGCIIYTSVNALEMAYTGNAGAPFRFIEILNSSGVYWTEHVTGESNIGIHFLWSDTGVSRVAEGRANPSFPEISDFLAGHVLEDYDPVTGQITQTDTVGLEVKIALVTNRFFIISFGEIGKIKKQAFFYDIVLQRWGKLKIDHLDIFDLNLPERPAAPDADSFDSNIDDEAQDYPDTYAYQLLPGNPDENFRAGKFGILTSEGAIQEINISDTVSYTDGMLIFTGMAVTRNRWSEIFEAQAKGKNGDLEISIRSELSDGIYTDWVDFTYYPELKKYLNNTVGSTHQIRVQGPMHLSSLVIALAILGTE